MEISLLDLLDGRDEREFSASDLSTKAQDRSGNGEFYSAALLFEAAARICNAEYESGKSDVNQYLSSYSRAGICFSQAGYFEKAKPILLHSTEADWAAAGLEKDTHIVKWCYVELLAEEAKLPADDLAAQYQNAVAHCKRLHWSFPSIKSEKELMRETTAPSGLQILANELKSIAEYRKQATMVSSVTPPRETKKQGSLGTTQFELRSYTALLEDWFSASIKEFVAEHPDTVVSAIGLHFVMAANKPWFIFALDTKESSDYYVEKYPEWCGEDKHGKFCNNPADFQYEYRNFTFDDFPDIFDLEYSQLNIITTDNEIIKLELNEDREVDDKIIEVLFAFTTSAVKSFQGYKLLERDDVFRIVITLHNSPKREIWAIA